LKLKQNKEMKMSVKNQTSRILGLAFLLQFITSVSSGLFFRPLWLVPDDIGATMLKIAENPNLLRANILVDMLTALGVIFLGALLFITPRKQNEKNGTGWYGTLHPGWKERCWQEAASAVFRF